MRFHSFAWPRTSALAVLLAVLAGPACIRLHGPEDMRRELARTAGVKLDREMGLTITRSGVWLARKIMKWSGEEEISLKGVRRVEIGVYQVDRLREGYTEPASLRSVDFAEWSPVVKVHDDGEDAMVLLKEKDGRVKGMLVVAADDEEWVLVRVWGNLDRVMEEVMRMAFDQVDRPDLYDRTREERGLGPVQTTVDLTSLDDEAQPFACVDTIEWVEPVSACTGPTGMLERL